MLKTGNLKPDHKKERLSYELRLVETGAGTGYFSCVPLNEPEFENALRYLRGCPNDEFMRHHVLKILEIRPAETLQEQIRKAGQDIFLLTLFYEACQLSPRFRHLKALFKEVDIQAFINYTPLIRIKSQQMPDQDLHRKWINFFKDNLLKHQILPCFDQTGLVLPFSKEVIDRYINKDAVSIEKVQGGLAGQSGRGGQGGQPGPENSDRPEPAETERIALESLKRAGVQFEMEMRHEGSLSPIALLREWQLDLGIENGRHHYTLKGKQTSYGRGLDLPPARAALVMEIVERCSSFTGFDKDRIPGYEKEYPLIYGSFRELEMKGRRVLDPNTLCLEAPYRDESIYWMEGEVVIGKPYELEREPIWVPVQCIFLFCNLDEPKLFSGLGSTGLASGNTPDEAKVRAILEVIERDCDAVTPYHPARCFEVETRDLQIARLLAAYRDRGIRVLFQDLTPAWGVPCCKCFVIEADGNIIKGTGAGLNAKQALISAMTETPYPFPHGGSTLPGPDDLIRVPLENLPDYSTGTASGDLRVLENLLAANDFYPIYVDLTREDLGLPVVRAIIPGMEILGDFGIFSRVHPRLFANYLMMERVNG